MVANKINIAVVDDHLTFRQALVNILNETDHLHILFEAEDGNQLIEKLTIFQPDIILLDIKMPKMRGTVALKIVHELYPSVRVLMLTAFFDEVYILDCLQYGINGFLTKNMDVSEIIKAIETAYRNEVYFSNLLGNSYLKNYIAKNKKEFSKILPEFTSEEIRIIELLQLETSTTEISQIMCLSSRSIELKREKMKEKAKVKTVAGLLMYCLKRGLID